MTCRHFEVLSPEMVSYSSYEPPEHFRCWAMVEASSRRDAILAAYRLPEFKEWVDEARGDGKPPFAGLKASRPICEHGHCWGCSDCPQCCAVNPLNDWETI